MPSRTSSQNVSRHRSTLSLQKTEITIHVYDLLPQGRLSSVLWAVGASLLHSGVVINGREYAYGGHDRPGLTGVYWTKPGLEPPGGTFRQEILHGFTLASDEDISTVLREASDEFLGTKYNLLTRNCNHFTSYLCEKLTGTPAPGWLNRAASIGVALPCMVPKDWVEPPEYETADGELLDEDEHDTNERSHMLGDSQARFVGQEDQHELTDWASDEEERYTTSKDKGKQRAHDSEGRALPAAEQAPRPSA